MGQGTFEELLERLEELVADVESFDAPARDKVFELLDGIDAMHRLSLGRLIDQLEPDTVRSVRRDAAVEWLLEAYGLGLDQREAAESALQQVRPYIHSHGGEIEVLGVTDGVVRVRMSGSCSGCTASDVTLREGVEAALREHFRGFTALEVEEDDARPHEPPGPTLVEIRMRKDSLQHAER